MHYYWRRRQRTLDAQAFNYVLTHLMLLTLFLYGSFVVNTRWMLTRNLFHWSAVIPIVVSTCSSIETINKAPHFSKFSKKVGCFFEKEC